MRRVWTRHSIGAEGAPPTPQGKSHEAPRVRPYPHQAKPVRARPVRARNERRAAGQPVGEQPLVSIGLPAFNGERYLASTIRSILDQDFADFELIIGDNASTDGTRAVCEAFAAADPRIRYHHNPRNLGAGPNYDLCFHRSRGRYFKWAAHDDMLAPGFLSAAVAAL